MSTHTGWIGVDLDGTLAEYTTWKGSAHIGAPVPAMLARVKAWLAEGKDVRILTARASPGAIEANNETLGLVVGRINSWCQTHLGRTLPVTCEKDFRMAELWDDRCVQVIPNTGQRADGANVATGTEADVCKDIADRQARGIRKYGTTVAENNLSLKQWHQHLYEELLDAAVYAKRAMEEIDRLEAERARSV